MKVDINLLPPEYRPKRWALPLTILLIVIILAIGYYSYGFVIENTEATNEIDRLQSQLDSLNAEINSVINDPTIKEYIERVADAQSEVDTLGIAKQDYEKYNIDRIYVMGVLQTVRELAPSDVILISFEQNDNEIAVEGELSSETQNSVIIVEYAKLLEGRNLFSRVAFEIDTEERTVDEKTVEVIIFTLLLEVMPGAV